MCFPPLQAKRNGVWQQNVWSHDNNYSYLDRGDGSTYPTPLCSSDSSQTASLLLPTLYLMTLPFSLPPSHHPSLPLRRNTFTLMWNRAKCQPGRVRSPNKNNCASKSHICPRLRGREKRTDPLTLLCPQNYERRLTPMASALFAHHVAFSRLHREDVQNVTARIDGHTYAVV